MDKRYEDDATKRHTDETDVTKFSSDGREFLEQHTRALSTLIADNYKISSGAVQGCEQVSLVEAYRSRTRFDATQLDSLQEPFVFDLVKSNGRLFNTQPIACASLFIIQQCIDEEPFCYMDVVWMQRFCALTIAICLMDSAVLPVGDGHVRLFPLKPRRQFSLCFFLSFGDSTNNRPMPYL